MFHTFGSDWERREYFRYYMDEVRCTYSLTVQIDITKLRNTLQSNNLKAYPAQIYMLARAVNQLPEFRMGTSEDGKPGYWDTFHPSYTIFNAQIKTFSSIWTPYDAAFEAFYQSCMEDIAQYGLVTSFAPKAAMPPNIFTVSIIPWVDFTAFNLNVYSDDGYLAHIFTMGKYVKKGKKHGCPLPYSCTMPPGWRLLAVATLQLAQHKFGRAGFWAKWQNEPGGDDNARHVRPICV